MKDEPHFSVVVYRVLALLDPEDGDDDPPPSDADIVMTLRLLTAAYLIVPHLFARAAVSTFEGAIHLYWRKPETALSLEVHNGKTRLYRRLGGPGANSYLFERPVTPELLIDALAWYADPTPLPKEPA